MSAQNGGLLAIAHIGMLWAEKQGRGWPWSRAGGDYGTGIEDVFDWNT